MSASLRRILPTGAVNPRIITPVGCRLQTPCPWRSYAHSSYGGEGDKDGKASQRTRDLEHPGPKTSSSSSSSSSGSRPPNQGGSATDSPEHRTPSNEAHPTITDGLQSDKVDEYGNTRGDVPSDVKRHNEDMDHRYDRSYNQVGAEEKGPK